MDALAYSPSYSLAPQRSPQSKDQGDASDPPTKVRLILIYNIFKKNN